ncbi:hypothetical protein [Cryobacterium sp. Y29]|uniref:hypothetical protein n=1 Tax=Cryobacterium sp. Y29 TaxID=2048285 RepID=UPI0018EDBCD4|nr:hypothetical protein [Cryobacterium sp. Y29]
MFEVLRNRTYRRLFSAQIVALIGTGMLTVALGLLTVISYHSLFVGTIIGFAGSALLVFTATLPTHQVAVTTPFVERLTRDVRVFSRTPQLRALLAMNMVVATSTSTVIVNTVVRVQSHFGRAQSDFALALACYGFGSMPVALALPRVLERFHDRNVMLLGCAVLPVGATVAPLLRRDQPTGRFRRPVFSVPCLFHRHLPTGRDTRRPARVGANCDRTGRHRDALWDHCVSGLDDADDTSGTG